MSIFLKVRELSRPDLEGTKFTQIAYRSFFGEAFANIERRFVRNNWVKVSEPEQEGGYDCVLVTLYGLSKGSFAFKAWVKSENLRPDMDTDIPYGEVVVPKFERKNKDDGSMVEISNTDP